MARKFSLIAVAATASIALSSAVVSAADYDYPDDRTEHYSGHYYAAPAYPGYAHGGYVSERVYEDDDNDVVVIERDYYNGYAPPTDYDGNGVDDDADTTLSSSHNTSAYRGRYWRD